MKPHITSFLGCIALLLACVSSAFAVRVSVNGEVVFFDDFEGAAPISSAAFPDNTDGGNGPGVFYPTNPNVGTWNTLTATPLGLQVTDFETPGALEGNNYLRVVRKTDSQGFPTAQTNVSVTTPGDTLRFETALNVATFTSTASGGMTQFTRVFALFDTSATPISTINLEVGSDGRIYNRPNATAAQRQWTGLNIAFDSWQTLAVDYTIGSSTWSLTYDGQFALGLSTWAGNNGLVSAVNIGGGNYHATNLSGGTSLYYDAVPPFTAMPVTMYIDRTTGEVILENLTGAAIDKIIGYSITSASGALDQANWTTIAGNYDSGLFDTDPWTVLTNEGVYTDLSESVFGGDGGTLGIGAALHLGTPWIKGIQEDLEISLIRDDGGPEGELIPVVVQFIPGTQNLEQFEFGDLEFDGDIDVDDFRNVFIPNYLQTNDGASAALQYQKGDFNRDGITDFMDFLVLNDAFQAANPGAAALSFSNAVPEPASLALLSFGGLAMLLRYRRKLFAGVVGAGVAILSCASAEAVELKINGDVVFRDDFENTTPVSTAAYPDNSNGGVYTPNNSNVGSWSSFSTDPAGIQVTNFAVPGAAQGDNYLRAVRNAASLALPFGLLNHSATNVGDTLRFETKLNVTTFTSTHPQQAVQFTRLFALLDNQETPVFIINLELGSDGIIYNRPSATASQRTSTGLSVAFDSWKTLAVDYTVGSPTWTLTYDGQTLAAGLPTWAGNNGLVSAVNVGGGNYNATNLSGGTALHYDALPAPEPYARMNLEVNTETGAMWLFNESGQATEIDSYRIRSAGNSLDPNGWQSLDFNNVGGSGTWDELGKTISELSEAYIGQGTIFASGSSQPLGFGYDENVDARDLIFEYHLAGTSAAMLLKADVFYVGGGLDGDHNNDGIVNAADYVFWRDTMGDMPRYNEWKANFGATSGSGTGATAVPEPTGLALLAILAGVVAIVRRGAWPRRFAFASARVVPHGIAVLVAVTVNSVVFAAVTDDRLYTLGDTPGEFSSEGAVVNSDVGFGFEVLDSVPGGVGGFVDLAQAGGPTYTDVGPDGLNRPGAMSGDWGVRFDGSDDSLTGLRLNNPGSVGESQGMQMWVYPTASALGTARQGIVFDSINSGGPSITANGRWTQVNSGHINDTDIAATIPVVGDTWHHVMHHIYRNVDPGSPKVVPGSGATSPYTSVLYVNGIAVSANNDTIGTTAGGLVVGAELSGGVPANHFNGVIDDLSMYTVTGNTFKLFEDNAWIATQIALIPGGLEIGDATRDGNVDPEDVTAFVTGWLKEKRFDGAHNDIWVGDWETWGWGDMNLDGQVNIVDALLMNRALNAAGAGGLDFSLLGGGPTVPEPSSAMLALGSLIGCMAYRRGSSRLQRRDKPSRK